MYSACSSLALSVGCALALVPFVLIDDLVVDSLYFLLFHCLYVSLLEPVQNESDKSLPLSAKRVAIPSSSSPSAAVVFSPVS